MWTLLSQKWPLDAKSQCNAMQCNAMHSIVNRLEDILSAYLMSSASTSSSSASSPASAPAASPAAYNNNVLYFSQQKRGFSSVFLWNTFDK